MKLVKCLRCGEYKIHKSRGLCVKCFNKSWRDGSVEEYPPITVKRGICKRCNEVKSLIKGLCKDCSYKKKKTFYSLSSNVLKKGLNNKFGEERKNMKKEIKELENKIIFEVIRNPKKFLKNIKI